MSELVRLGSCYRGTHWNLHPTARPFDTATDKLSTEFVEERELSCGCCKEHVKQLRGPATRPLPPLSVLVDGIRACYESAPTMGCDPEFFLSRNGQFTPAFDHLMGKASAPDAFPFWDGFQAEIRPSPDDCHQILAQHIASNLANVPNNLEILPKAVIRVPTDMLERSSDAHVELGCDASRNVYGMSGQCVREPRKLIWRFAGGHVHFKLPNEERESPQHVRHLVKTLDAYCGVPCVAMAQNYDHYIRRRYYGLAGEFRLPKHGLEWRTLSNFWVIHPQAFMLVFDLARHALNIGRSGVRRTFVGSERIVRDVINSTDVRSAKELVGLNREFYSAWNKLKYGHDKAFFEACKGGIDKVIKDWGLDVRKAWAFSDWQLAPKWADVA